MKMTKIAFWRAILKECNKPNAPTKNKSCFAWDTKVCDCEKSCLMKKKTGSCEMDASKYLVDWRDAATAYIKRNEGKNRKKATPNFDSICAEGELPKVSPKKYVDPTPLDIAKMIRDNNYGCHKIVLCKKCPVEKTPCGNSTTTKENFDTRKKVIDSYISSHEKIELEIFVPARNVGKTFMRNNEKAIKELQRLFELGEVKIDVDWGLSKLDHEKPEPVIEPIKFDDPVPEYVYMHNFNTISRIKIAKIVREKTLSIICEYAESAEGNFTRYELKCLYRTPEDAVAVAKSKWNEVRR